MSPAGAHFFAFFAGFLRVSGDEPWNQLADAIPGAFSPREWG